MSWFDQEKQEVKQKFSEWWAETIHRPRPQWWVGVALVVGILVGLILGG